ncbi:MAG: carboxypeptidase regulatory-like domain-containing protein [Pirellulales bacterium]|nr:carboxypeptidase regulatory-like domain-containing protein [Pirellulales bacterium]
MVKASTRSCAWLLLGLAATVGCGSRVEISPVSGVVTLNGKPVPKAKVRFMPAPQEDPEAVKQLAMGETDEQGRYSLTVFRGPEGAAVGLNRVMITTRVVDDNEKVLSRETIPAQYNSRTTLTFAVPPGGTDQANFDLSR